MTDRRLNETEVAKIFEKATELQDDAAKWGGIIARIGKNSSVI